MRRSVVAARACCRARLPASGPTPNPNVIVVGIASGPNNLDPRIGTDDVVAEGCSS